MKLSEIYNLLLAGKTLQLPFDSEREAEAFRVALFRHKRLQDNEMIKLGMFDETERQQLSWSLQGELFDHPFLATVKFRERQRKSYRVIILNEPEEADEEEADEQQLSASA